MIEVIEPRIALTVTPSVEFLDEFTQIELTSTDRIWTNPNDNADKQKVDYNNPLVKYVNDPTTLSIVDDSAARDGKALKLSMHRNQIDSTKFDSAAIWTGGIAPFTYGHIEARIKLPGGPNGEGTGLWPAFWLLGADGRWPGTGEIDIMEYKGGETKSVFPAIHGNNFTGSSYSNGGYTSSQDFFNDYHLFAVDWTPNHIVYSVDNQLIWDVTPSSPFIGSDWTFNHGFRIVLNMSAGTTASDSFTVAPNASTNFPASMYVDYVRATRPDIDFLSMPATQPSGLTSPVVSASTTNLADFVVSGSVLPQTVQYNTTYSATVVSVNGQTLTAAELDAKGSFAKLVHLNDGTNSISVTIANPNSQTITSSTFTQTVVLDPNLSLTNREIVLIDVVGGALDGTVVLDPFCNSILGALPGKHIRGKSADGSKLYMDDLSEYGAYDLKLKRKLAFTQPIASNGFVVDPTGKWLYSGNEVLDLASNSLRSSNLPVSISTGNGYLNARVAGGPTISADGKTIFGGTPVVRIDVPSNTASAPLSLPVGDFLSDLALSPDQQTLLVSAYGTLAGYTSSYARVVEFDVATLNRKQVIQLGDFAGNIELLGNNLAAVGSAGNPSGSTLSGGVAVFDITSGQTKSSVSITLADNVAFSLNDRQIYVTDGDGCGISAWTVDAAGQLQRGKSFNLGINRFQSTSSIPANDQINGVFFRSAIPSVLPAVSLAVAPNVLPEQNGLVTITAILSQTSSQNVLVGLSYSGTAQSGIDHSGSDVVIAIPAGALSASILIRSRDDSTFEGDETIVVDISGVTNGNENGTQSVTATITDDDTQPNVTVSLSGSPLAENGGTAIVRATLSNPSTQQVEVNLGLTGTATSNVDYSASSVTIAIAAGQTSGSITLSTLDDLLKEGNETIVVDVVSVANGTQNGSQQVTASIVDDSADPFQLLGNTLTFIGTTGDDTLAINFGGSTSSFTAVVNASVATFSASTITIDGVGGKDTLTVTLSSLADIAALGGLSGSITSSNYSISIFNTETKILIGGPNDSVDLNDSGSVVTAYLLPAYAIMQDDSGAYKNQVVGFDNYTANASGNNDQLFIYGDSGNQTYTATPTKSTMPVGSQTLVGNNFLKVYAYGNGGADTATYSGSSANETMTALSRYTFVKTTTAVQYFDRFSQLTIDGNGGDDTAVMYDSAGNDTFIALDGSYTFSGTNFRNVAIGYDRCYAFQYFGGKDTATLNGSAGNDRLTVVLTYSALQTPTSLLQATGFSTVIVNAGTGTGMATMFDSSGNDTFKATGSTAELTYGNGKNVRVVGFNTVYATSKFGGTDRKKVTNPLKFTLRFTGPWV